MEARAEIADRFALFVIHLILLVLVILSMRGSSVSAREVGLTADNWKSALGMGVMFSLLPLGLSELFLSHVPREVAREEAESRGPVATWSGLIALGSFSSKIWLAFCIVALIRHGFSAWLAIVLAALFFATVSLQISIARALGAAFGRAADVIGGLANLYYVRHACSGDRPPSSRYSRPRPVCGEVIQLSRVRWAGDMVPCRNCGECLTTKEKYLWVIGVVSILTSAHATRHLIYRDPGYFLVTEGVAFALFLVMAFCFGLMVPPALKRVQGKAFDKELSLFELDGPTVTRNGQTSNHPLRQVPGKRRHQKATPLPTT